MAPSLAQGPQVCGVSPLLLIQTAQGLCVPVLADGTANTWQMLLVPGLSINFQQQQTWLPQGSRVQTHLPQPSQLQSQQLQAHQPQSYPPQIQQPHGHQPQSYPPQCHQPPSYPPQCLQPQSYLPQSCQPQAHQSQSYLPQSSFPGRCQPQTHTPNVSPLPAPVGPDLRPTGCAPPGYTHPKCLNAGPAPATNRRGNIPLAGKGDDVSRHHMAPVPPGSAGSRGRAGGGKGMGGCMGAQGSTRAYTGYALQQAAARLQAAELQLLLREGGGESYSHGLAESQGQSHSAYPGLASYNQAVPGAWDTAAPCYSEAAVGWSEVDDELREKQEHLRSLILDTDTAGYFLTKAARQLQGMQRTPAYSLVAVPTVPLAQDCGPHGPCLCHPWSLTFEGPHW